MQGSPNRGLNNTIYRLRPLAIAGWRAFTIGASNMVHMNQYLLGTTRSSLVLCIHTTLAQVVSYASLESRWRLPKIYKHGQLALGGGNAL